MLRKIGCVAFLCLLSTEAISADRFIIKYKPNAEEIKLLSADNNSAKIARIQMMQPLSKAKVSNLSAISGVQIKELNPIATGAHVIVLNTDLDPVQTQQFIDKVKSDNSVEYIEEDRILQTASDPVNLNENWQWDMDTMGFFEAAPQWQGDDIVAAWKLMGDNGFTPGGQVVIAVVDTGYTPHPNFLSALQKLNGQSNVYGYQFMSDCRMSGQCAPSTSSSQASGDYYSPNALDLGDYVSLSDIDSSNGFFNSGCFRPFSTWHGSHVTGTLVANGYSTINPTYIAGGAYGAKVIPVRVLGKCGGYNSDILNGMLWAAGYNVTTTKGVPVPANPNPAQVINLSLSGTGGCSQAQQDAVNTITNGGVVIVAAAGNNSTNFSQNNPANCGNVISVAAKGPTNTLASYSNYGNTTITASGGDRSVSLCSSSDSSCASSIYSTVWSSVHGFVPESQGGYGAFATYQGTSMAAPHVAAAVADMISVLRATNSSYTAYGIAQVLKQTAKPFNNCSTYGCASQGSLDAAAAINYVLENKSVPAMAPAPAPVASGGGGGCSAIDNGNDCSLTILLIGTVLYGYRRKRIRNKKY